MSPDPNDSPSRVLAVRVPEQLERQLSALAASESNTVSALIRRLLSRALVLETREGR